MSVKIFLSYSWANKLEADIIDNFLKDQNFFVKRDVREVFYKRNIKEFMKSIGDSDFVITLVSDTFLKSHNCMYEMLELIKTSDYRERVVQVILKDAKIFKPIDRASYLIHWSNECSKLEEILHSNIQDNAKAELQTDYQQYKDIEKTIYDFTSFIAVERGVSMQELQNSNFKELTDYIGVNFKSSKPVSKNAAQLANLNDFKIKQQLHGKIKLIYNYGFFIQVASPHGFRDGLLHINKLKDFGYDFAQLKRFFSIGDDIHVEVCDINPQSKAAFQTGGLGFTVTDIFEKVIFEKVRQEIIKTGLNLEEVLNLRGLNLRDLPSEISEAKSITQVMLSGNKFNEMPLVLDLLPNLKIVFCDFEPKRPLRYNYLVYNYEK